MSTFVQENHQGVFPEGEFFQQETGAFSNLVLGGSLWALVVFVLQLYPQGDEDQKECLEAKLYWMILELTVFQKSAGKFCKVSLKASLKKNISCFIVTVVFRK